MALYRVMVWLTKPDGKQFEEEGLGETPHAAALAALERIAEHHYVEPGDVIEIDDMVELDAGA